MLPPFIKLGSYYADSYLLMAALAFIASSLLVFLRRKSQDIAGWEAIVISIVTFLGGVFGAKMFHIVGSVIKGEVDGRFWTAQFWQNFSLFNGFVWYGGVIGAFLFLTIYAGIKKIPLKNIMDLMTPFALLFDAIARFGCLFAGCCYGKAAAWGIKMHGIIRFPSPLFETILCLIILTQIFIWKPERKRPGILLPLYLVAYSIGRFFLEFFRGDESRGAFLMLSTSQWIAMLILLALAIGYIVMRKKRIQVIKNEKMQLRQEE